MATGVVGLGRVSLPEEEGEADGQDRGVRGREGRGPYRFRI
jgi:hypothetical protein